MRIQSRPLQVQNCDISGSRYIDSPDEIPPSPIVALDSLPNDPLEFGVSDLLSAPPYR